MISPVLAGEAVREISGGALDHAIPSGNPAAHGWLNPFPARNRSLRNFHLSPPCLCRTHPPTHAFQDRTTLHRGTRHHPSSARRVKMDRSHGWNMQQQHSASGIPAVQAAKLRYESARTFDSDEDIEWNPCMTSEELTAAYSESSLSSRSGRSEASSPPQQATIPLPMNPYAQQQQQHLQHGNQNSGRYNSRKNRNNNAVPIVNPSHFNVQQWR